MSLRRNKNKSIKTIQQMAKLNRTKVKNAIDGCYGVLSTVARKCDVTRAAIYNFLKKEKNQDLALMLKTDGERILDIAENKLFASIALGNKKDIQFLLKTKGKDRGYVEKQEVAMESKNETKIDLAEFENYIEEDKKEEEKKSEQRTTGSHKESS